MKFRHIILTGTSVENILIRYLVARSRICDLVCCFNYITYLLQ